MCFSTTNPALGPAPVSEAPEVQQRTSMTVQLCQNPALRQVDLIYHLNTVQKLTGKLHCMVIAFFGS
jgi:NifU-like protein involved in Fe-S cluster formation